MVRPLSMLATWGDSYTERGVAEMYLLCYIGWVLVRSFVGGVSIFPATTRKKEDQLVESRVVHLRIPMYLFNKLRELASAEDEEVNDYIRLVLRDHVKGAEWERERVANGKMG